MLVCKSPRSNGCKASLPPFHSSLVDVSRKRLAHDSRGVRINPFLLDRTIRSETTKESAYVMSMTGKYIAMPSDMRT